MSIVDIIDISTCNMNDSGMNGPGAGAANCKMNEEGRYPTLLSLMYQVMGFI